MRRISTRSVITGTVGLTLAFMGLGTTAALAATGGVTPGGTTLIVDGVGTDIDRLTFTLTDPATGTVRVDSASAATITPLNLDPRCSNPVSDKSLVCTGVLRLLVRGGDGDDTLTNATALPSNLQGQVGNDTLNGGSGDDLLNGGTGVDTVNGNGGNDQFFMQGEIADIVNCGDGADTATVDDSDVVNADCETILGRTPTGAPPGTTPGTTPGGEPVQVFPEAAAGACEAARTREGTSGRDTLEGTAFGDVLIGLGGADVLAGLAGGDCLYGGGGGDRMRGGDGADFVKGDAGKDQLRGNGGTDRLAGDKGRDVIAGGLDADVIAAGSGNDRASGGGGDDIIGGGRKKDRLAGGAGVDQLFGGAGRDAINAVDGVADVVDCGGGRDSARVDSVDQVSNCEAVTRN